MKISSAISAVNTMNVGSTSNAIGNVGGEQYVAQVTDVGDSSQENQQGLGNESTKAVEKQLIQAIEKANKLQANSTECEFSIHEATKQIMIKVIDTNTKQVVKEIPSEKILDMVANMCELAGMFVDVKR